MRPDPWFDPSFDCCDVNMSDPGLRLSEVLATLEARLEFESNEAQEEAQEEARRESQAMADSEWYERQTYD